MPPQAVDQQTSIAIETVPPANATPVLAGTAALSDSTDRTLAADLLDPALIDTAIRPAVRISADSPARPAAPARPDARVSSDAMPGLAGLADLARRVGPAARAGLAGLADLAGQGVSTEVMIGLSIIVAVLLTGIGVVSHLAAAVVIGVVIGVSAAFVLASRGMGEGKAR